MHTVPRGVDEDRTGTVENVERSNLVTGFPPQNIPFVDADNGANGEVRVHERRAVQRIEHDAVGGVGLKLHDVFLLFRNIATDEVCLAEEPLENIVAQHIELELLLPILILVSTQAGICSLDGIADVLRRTGNIDNEVAKIMGDLRFLKQMKIQGFSLWCRET